MQITDTTEPAIADRSNRIRTMAYWAFTLFVAFENSAGAMWVLLPMIPGLNQTHPAMVFAEYLHVMLAHLGYPSYFKYILGPWQFACAVVLLAPGLQRAKEWAYIGAFFNYSSAFASHLFVGDGPQAGAAAFALFTVFSWALRPADRRLGDSNSGEKTSARSWAAAAGTLLLLLLLSLLYLPPIPTH